MSLTQKIRLLFLKLLTCIMDLSGAKNHQAALAFGISLSVGLLAFFFPSYLPIILVAQGLSLVYTFSLYGNEAERRYAGEIRRLNSLHHKDGIRIARLEERMEIGRQSKRGRQKAPF